MTLSAPVELPAITAEPKHKSITKLVVATSIGNALEWFDISADHHPAVRPGVNRLATGRMGRFRVTK